MIAQKMESGIAVVRNSLKTPFYGLGGKLVAVIAVLLFFSFPVSAEETASKVIIKVLLKGNKNISTTTILSKIRMKPGSPFSQEIANDDIKRLYALGYFTDVAVDAEDQEGGVVVTVIVEEKPVIKDIIFEGNSKISAKRLKKIMQLKTSDMLNFSKLSEDLMEIKSFYERNGFYQINAKYELEKDEEGNNVTIKIIIDEKTRMRIKRVFIEGNKAVKAKKIKELMETRPAWIFRRGYFDDGTFENDLTKIKAYYQDLGYLDMSVTPSLDYDRQKGLIFITLKIAEGKEYYFGDIAVKGNTVFPEEEIMSKISSKKGNPFSYSALREDIENVRTFYYHEGYMNVEVGVDRALHTDTQTVDIVFNIDAKEVVYIGRINIKGNTKTKDIVIRRELRAYPGEKFDGDKIRRSKERLYNLGFFEDIYFETTKTDKPNVSDLDITVKETKTGEFSFGGGYSSIDEFIGFVEVVQKNFDLFNFPYFTGDGQNLSVKAELGTVRSNYNISWTEPWIFDYPLSFGVDAYHWTHYRRTHVGYGFDEKRFGGDVRFGKEFLEYFRADLMYKLENVDISDISDDATQDLKDEEGDNWLSRLGFGIVFDNRDNVFSPTKGFVSSLSMENVGGFLMGDKDFLKGFTSNSFYYSPIKKIVIELSARVGLAQSYWNTDEVPIYERYFAGGANTIRGYQERKVGPRDPSSNDPIGGEALLVGNAELTFPLYEKIVKGAVFYDVGNVWRRIEDFAQGGYKQGVGIGVRVKTPIGPLKLDWGYPLNDNHDDDKEGQFYFSVSHGF
ncbi:MAG: outer membrane protein assembly factor BamA [Candidatus Omnitrophica bacterium]|nr:outer membrane protein assembly factor BamA [Candidatus Omnitrophota bacterium]